MRIVSACLALLVVSGAARAETPAVAPVAPATTTPQLIVPPPPPPLPPPPPRYVPSSSAPSALPDWADLARRGREKKIAGAALVGLGSAATVLGAALLADGLYTANGSALCDRYRCTVNDEAAVGVFHLVAGTVAAIAGIPVYVVGVEQSRRAARMRWQSAVTATPDGVALRF